jgi:hypothetical protein
MMARREKQEPMVLSQETKRVTRIEYSNDGLVELISRAVLKACNIKPSDKVRVNVQLSGGDEGCDVTCTVIVDEVLDA